MAARTGLPHTLISIRRSQRPPAIASGRYLLPETIAEIRTIMNRRRMRANDIMAEMGFAGDDLSLTRALSKGASLRLSVIAALETWLRNNAAE